MNLLSRFSFLLFLLSQETATSRVAKVGEEEDGRELGRYGPPPNRALGMVVVKSENSFDVTYQTLVEALVEQIGIIREIDHAAAAADAGIEPPLPPNSVVIFGNPVLGTPVMQENFLAGLDLPQKMSVWEDQDGDVFLGFNPPKYLAARYEGIEGVPQLETIGGALKNFASAATGVAVADIMDPPMYQFDKISRLDGGWFCVESNTDFETTWTRLVTAITEGPPEIALEVDHQENSFGALRPLRVVVFGNPQLGTPLMQRSPTAGIDLPLKIMVGEDENGKVKVISNKIGFIQRRHQLRGVKDNIQAARQAVLNFVSAASGVEFH